MQAGAAKALHTRKQKSGVTIEESCGEAWERLRSDATEDRFCVFGYADTTVITHRLSGPDPQELLANLSEDEVLFGAIRVDREGGLGPKFISFTFFGEAVNGMRKGRGAMHRNAVMNIMEGTHDTFEGEGIEPFTHSFNTAVAQP